MKTKIWKQTMTAVLAVLLLVGILPVGAAEIGTQDFITNGSFEDLTETEQGGWTVYNSNHADKLGWADMLKTDGASGEGNNYILIEAVKGADTCNSGLRHSNTQIEPGKDLILSMKYKSNATSAMQIQYSYGASAYDVSYQPDNNFVLPATGGAWADYTLLIPAYAFEIEGVDAPVYADTVGFLFYNVARLAKDVETGTAVAEGVTVSVGFDDISLRTYTDEGLIKNGDFTLGNTGWTPKVTASKDPDATYAFEDGVMKLYGKAQGISVSAPVIPNETLLPDGITMVRYRLSFKYKAFDSDGNPVTIGTTAVGMGQAGHNTDNGEVQYLLRNPSPTYTRPLADGWTECVYYTRTAGSGSNKSQVCSSPTATKVSLDLKGTDLSTWIWYDDVEVTALPVYVQTTTDDGTAESVSIAAGDKIKVSAVAANRTESAVTPQLYVAFYSEGTNGKTLLSMETVAAEAEVAANTVSVIEKTDIIVPAANDGESISMKVYVWSGSGLVPLGGAYTLSGAVTAS